MHGMLANLDTAWELKHHMINLIKNKILGLTSPPPFTHTTLISRAVLEVVYTVIGLSIGCTHTEGASGEVTRV